jgi:hypothetical protein
MRMPAKDPDEVLDYGLEWSDVLEDGETISTSSWTATAGITLGTSGATAPSISSTQTLCWLSGGTAGSIYTITNRIVTSESRTYDRSFDGPVQTR